jgi:hypothetical protein
VRGRVSRILGERFEADIIDRLLEHGSIRAGILDGLALAAANHREGIAFVNVQVCDILRVAAPANLTRLDQRYRDIDAADIDRKVLLSVGEAKLEGDVFDAVTIVVDLDFIDAVAVELEVVRAAVRIL